MKKIFAILVFGLMSLMTLTSCEDKFIYDDDKSFLPIGYNAKSPEDDDEEHISSTLLILGIHGLVFDEIEKSDWRIVTQSMYAFRGNQPLTLEETMIDITDTWSKITNIHTNYGDIPVTFGNMNVNYQYMGENIELEPIDGLSLHVRIEQTGLATDPLFMQHGKVVFHLLVGLCPVAVHEVNFLVLGENNTDGYTVEDWEETEPVTINL